MYAQTIYWMRKNLSWGLEERFHASGYKEQEFDDGD